MNLFIRFKYEISEYNQFEVDKVQQKNLLYYFVKSIDAIELKNQWF